MFVAFVVIVVIVNLFAVSLCMAAGKKTPRA